MNVTPEELLASHLRAYEERDAAAVVRLYSRPCTFIRPDGVWIVDDDATASVLVAHLIDHARSQGWERTAMLGLKVKPLAVTLAMLTGTFVRYSGDGDEIARSGFTYLARRDGESWKIAVAAAHDDVPDGQ